MGKKWLWCDVEGLDVSTVNLPQTLRVYSSIVTGATVLVKSHS